jgi:hypothetical protein
MKEPISIHVFMVGQHFGTAAVARRGRRVLYRTRVYPFGFDGPAYDACVEGLRDLGHDVGERDRGQGGVDS